MKNPVRSRFLLNTLFCAASALAITLPKSSLAYVYSCNDSNTDCVINYNKNAISENAGIQKYNLVRVVMPGKVTPEIGRIKSSANWLSNFYKTASHGQLNLRRNKVVTKEVSVGSCKQAKQEANSVDNSGVLFTIRVFPKGLCRSSNAGRGNANLVGTLKRDFAHEVGHLLGLKHGNRLNHSTGKVESYRDPSTFMGRYPSNNYSTPQLHWLGWTKKSDVVQLDTDILNSGGTLEVQLRPVDKNQKSNSDIPLAYVYDLPNNNRLFISIPKSKKDNTNAIKGGQVYFYKAPKCKSCRGMAMGDTVIATIGDPTNSRDYNVGGLIINPVAYDSQKVRFNGRSIDKFDTVTLRISKAPEYENIIAEIAESFDEEQSVSETVGEHIHDITADDEFKETEPSMDD